MNNNELSIDAIYNNITKYLEEYKHNYSEPELWASWYTQWTYDEVNQVVSISESGVVVCEINKDELIKLGIIK